MPTFYAQYNIDYATVTWNANGGAASESSRQVQKGQPVGTLPTWSRSGYTFNGWYTAASGGSKISASTVINNNVTYYAQSKQNISIVPSYGALTNRMLRMRQLSGAELYGSRILATFKVTGTGEFSVEGVINGVATPAGFTDSTYTTSPYGVYMLSYRTIMSETELKAMSGQWGIFFTNVTGKLTKINIYNYNTDELVNSTTVNYTLA